MLVLLIGFNSCEFDSGDIQYDLGNDFIYDPSQVIMIDTLTVRTYTTVADTFITSNANRLLTGRQINDYGIETYCEAYFRFETSGIRGFHQTAVYDSISMILHFDGYKSGDTTKVGEFGIYRLSEAIALVPNTNGFYNNTKFEVEQEPLATFSIDFSNHVDSVVLRLPDELGSELYRMVLNGSDTIGNRSTFTDYFKGVSIRPLNDNAAFVLGLKALADSASAPRMRVYYHDMTEVFNPYFDFPLEKLDVFDGVSASDLNNFYAFSHITNNYEGTIFEGIKPGEFRMPSTSTENISMMQSASLLRTIIDIPGVSSLYNFGVGSIIKAELIFEPLRDSYSQQSDLQSNLLMNLVDRKNRFFGPLYITGTNDLVYGVLNYDNVFREQTHYSIDITNFVKTEYEEIADPEYSLSLFIPYNAKLPHVDQLIIGGPGHRDHKMRLKVYMASF